MCVLGEKENPIIWKKNIFEAIKDLSDIELQKLTWAGKHPKFISSFTETLARLYDDLDFERYIEYYKFTNKEDNLLSLLIELDKLITAFKDFGYEIEMQTCGYKTILQDSKWVTITEKAKEIIIEWNKSNT